MRYFASGFQLGDLVRIRQHQLGQRVGRQANSLTGRLRSTGVFESRTATSRAKSPRWSASMCREADIALDVLSGTFCLGQRVLTFSWGSHPSSAKCLGTINGGSFTGTGGLRWRVLLDDTGKMGRIEVERWERDMEHVYE